jgi:hypothetical protein
MNCAAGKSSLSDTECVAEKSTGEGLRARTSDGNFENVEVPHDTVPNPLATPFSTKAEQFHDPINLSHLPSIRQVESCTTKGYFCKTAGYFCERKPKQNASISPRPSWNSVAWWLGSPRVLKDCLFRLY